MELSDIQLSLLAALGFSNLGFDRSNLDTTPCIWVGSPENVEAVRNLVSMELVTIVKESHLVSGCGMCQEALQVTLTDEGRRIVRNLSPLTCALVAVEFSWYFVAEYYILQLFKGELCEFLVHEEELVRTAAQKRLFQLGGSRNAEDRKSFYNVTTYSRKPQPTQS